jgi:ABC-2 type transport system ATP-binding protein
MMVIVLLVVLVIVGLVWLARRPRREIQRSAAGDPGVPAQEYASRAIPEEQRPRGRIEVSGLTKVYNGVAVVDDVSFSAEPGRVTGFLGPNGAGKTTTLRMLLGLVQPSSGVALIGRSRYGKMERPVVWVGAVLEASGAHDPQVLILDEPGNGLDPAGIRWIRSLLRSLADAGRTVLVSSHQLAEVGQVADDLVVIASGRVVAAGPVDSVVGSHSSLEDAFLSLTAGQGEIR